MLLSDFNYIGSKQFSLIGASSSTPPIIPPVVTNAVTLSSTIIRITFDQNMILSLLGWSFEINNIATASVSVSGALNIYDFVIVGPMAVGNLITWSYNSAIGNTVSAITGAELVTAIDQPVTNNLLISAIRIQKQVEINGNSASFTLPTTQHSLVLAYYMGTIGAFSNTVQDDTGTFLTSIAKVTQPLFGNCLEIFYRYDNPAGVVDYFGAGIGSNNSLVVVEYANIKFGTDPFLVAASNFGGTSPLEALLNLTNRALVIGGYYNNSVNDYLGLNGGLSLVNDNQLFNFSVQAEILAQAIGAVTPGFLIAGDPDDVAAFAAFEIS